MAHVLSIKLISNMITSFFCPAISFCISLAINSSESFSFLEISEETHISQILIINRTSHGMFILITEKKHGMLFLGWKHKVTNRTKPGPEVIKLFSCSTQPYIAQKESRFPEGLISSRRNDVNKGRAARFLAYS